MLVFLPLILQARSEIQDICHYRAADAADYVRETDRSLMQLVTALWATLALMYVSLAAITGKYPVRPGKNEMYPGGNRR